MGNYYRASVSSLKPPLTETFFEDEFTSVEEAQAFAEAMLRDNDKAINVYKLVTSTCKLGKVDIPTDPSKKYDDRGVLITPLDHPPGARSRNYYQWPLASDE